MKITTRQLKQIIREELARMTIEEGVEYEYAYDDDFNNRSGSYKGALGVRGPEWEKIGSDTKGGRGSYYRKRTDGRIEHVNSDEDEDIFDFRKASYRGPDYEFAYDDEFNNKSGSYRGSRGERGPEWEKVGSDTKGGRGSYYRRRT